MANVGEIYTESAFGVSICRAGRASELAEHVHDRLCHQHWRQSTGGLQSEFASHADHRGDAGTRGIDRRSIKTVGQYRPCYIVQRLE